MSGNDEIAATFDAFAEVLATVVSDDGLVRYEVLNDEPIRIRLREAIEEIASASLADNANRETRASLWINAFNANVLMLAYESWSQNREDLTLNVESALEEGAAVVAGERVPLIALRNRLRELADPRIHAALVYGAKGSPPLRREPFRAQHLDRQLDQQAQRWLDDMADHRAARDGLWLSPVFQQFESDFDVEPYRGVLGFVRKHSRPNGAIRDYVRSVGDIRIRYGDFDWSLNKSDD